jgi:hypothetical protein
MPLGQSALLLTLWLHSWANLFLLDHIPSDTRSSSFAGTSKGAEAQVKVLMGRCSVLRQWCVQKAALALLVG